MEREKLFEVKDLRISATNDDGVEIPIVKGVSFDIHKGEVVALIGESGSGKTTISLASLAYTKPGLHFAGGQALLNGEDVLTMAPLRQREIRGANVAYLAQSAAATFNPAITIGEQVTESAVLHGVLNQEEATKRAVELYHALELPDADRIGFRYPHQVSGGQLQRLMAAMALCGKPDLMVLDEPTTALDVTTQIEVLKAFKKVIREQNSAAIYVTHDLAVVAQIADHIVVLYSGEVMEQGTVDQIINNPQHAYTKRLMDAVRPKPVAGMGTEVSGDHDRHIDNIQVEDMTAGYGGIVNGEPMVTILRDINLSVENGHVVGVIGESGCGKSTLARVMAGMLPPARGTIKLDGKVLEGALNDRKLDELQKVQFVFQMADTALNPKQVIGDIIGRPLEFYHGLKGKEKHAKVAEILDLVELPADFASRYPMELSGGQKQRINMARALAANPEVMLCDEVTSALDSIVGANVIKLLTGLRDKTGVSFVFISHDLSTVASFADEIVVLYAGRIVEQGPTDEVLRPPFHPYTRLLISSVPEMRIGWLEDTMKKREMAVGIARGVEITAIGCPFYNRCPTAIVGTCDIKVPPILNLKGGHQISCHLTLEQLNETEADTQKILLGYEGLANGDGGAATSITASSIDAVKTRL
ncbi:MAG: peptide/nickel transport system ATP-binding protein [Planctomycetota bacterium]|jgi:peptide/nickel transport system ATP-binding protein